MSWVPAEVVLRTVAEQRQVLDAEQARVTDFANYHAAERAKVEAEYAAASHDLAPALLASLDAAAIAKAAEMVGLVGLPSEDIPAKLEARRSWLVGRLAEIEHDPSFVNRELLRHPRTGSLTRAIAEAEDMRKPASDVVVTCQEQLRFDRLWESGFGTPEFHAPWWRYSYWEDRAAASALVARFPGKTSFAEVRQEYASAKDTLDVFDADIARLRAELAACDALAREHAVLVDEHRTLDERALEHTRRRIHEHLMTSDTSLVSQRLQPWPAIRLLFLRTSGLAAKISYLEGIQRARLAEIQADLTTQRERIDGVDMRTRRRWAPMPSDKYEKLVVDRRPRFEKRWQSFGKVYRSVQSYDRWDRGRYYDDLLWWDLMTRGRHDGTYLPEVADFHRRHPDYRFEPDYKSLAADQAALREAEEEAQDDARAAAAGIEADSDDTGDLTQVDAS